MGVRESERMAERTGEEKTASERDGERGSYAQGLLSSPEKDRSSSASSLPLSFSLKLPCM